MKYLEHVDIKTIMDSYAHIIGWGTGPIFSMNYRTDYFPIDFLIDGTGKRAGTKLKGIPVKDEVALDEIEGKTLIVIYAIYEKEILEQISHHRHENIDTIIFPLLDVSLGDGRMMQQMNAKTCEDFLTLMAVRQIGLETVRYLEIGVCHPVMRNNTWLLREQFKNTKGYRGVLVEANPLCWDLIHEYRASDTLLECGVTTNVHSGRAAFYAFPELLGHSTFVKEIADKESAKGAKCIKYEIPTKNINRIIASAN